MSLWRHPGGIPFSSVPHCEVMSILLGVDQQDYQVLHPSLKKLTRGGSKRLPHKPKCPLYKSDGSAVKVKASLRKEKHSGGEVKASTMVGDVVPAWVAMFIGCKCSLQVMDSVILSLSPKTD